MAFELLDPAVVLPKFDVVTVDHFPRAFPCTVVVIADQIDRFHELAVTVNEVGAIVSHKSDLSNKGPHRRDGATWKVGSLAMADSKPRQI
jgi:hypothetical protein